MRRNDSLCSIASEISKIDSSYKIEVYSNEKDEKIYKELKEKPNIIYVGSIPYEKVQEKISKSEITVIVEGTKKKDIKLFRYFLSTKAAIVCTREDEIEKEIIKFYKNNYIIKLLKLLD